MAQGAERIKMLADNYIPVRQLGNGNTTGFSFDFDMMSEAYVRVYRETDGVQSWFRLMNIRRNWTDPPGE